MGTHNNNTLNHHRYHNSILYLHTCHPELVSGSQKPSIWNKLTFSLTKLATLKTGLACVISNLIGDPVKKTNHKFIGTAFDKFIPFLTKINICEAEIYFKA